MGFRPLFCLGLCLSHGDSISRSMRVPDWLNVGIAEHMDALRRITERVGAIAAPIIRALGLELVEVWYSGQGPRPLVRVFIDRPEGVRLADCEQLHHSLGHALDVEDPIPHPYTLEVSSPGVDRPFNKREDYQRSAEKRVRVKLKRQYDGEWRLSGRLVSVSDIGIVVALQEKRGEKTIGVTWDDIAETRRDVEF